MSEFETKSCALDMFVTGAVPHVNMTLEIQQEEEEDEEIDPSPQQLDIHFHNVEEVQLENQEYTTTTHNNNNYNYNNNNNYNSFNNNNNNSNNDEIFDQEEFGNQDILIYHQDQEEQEQQEEEEEEEEKEEEEEVYQEGQEEQQEQQEQQKEQDSDGGMSVVDLKNKLNKQLSATQLLGFSPGSPGLVRSFTGQPKRPIRPLPKPPGFSLNSPVIAPVGSPSLAQETNSVSSPVVSPSVSSRKVTTPKPPVSTNLMNFRTKPLPMTPPQSSPSVLSRQQPSVQNNSCNNNIITNNNNNIPQTPTSPMFDQQYNRLNDYENDSQTISNLDLNTQLNQASSDATAYAVSPLGQSVDESHQSYMPARSIPSEISLLLIFYMNSSTQSAPSSPTITSGHSTSPSTPSSLGSSPKLNTSGERTRPQSTQFKSILFRSTPNITASSPPLSSSSPNPLNLSQQLPPSSSPPPQWGTRVEKILKFSPCSTVDEVLSLAIPNLVHHKGLQKAKHTNNDEWEPTDIDGAPPASGEHHYSFALFRRNNPLVPLHKERTLLELGLNDMEPLELKTIVLNIQFVKIHIPCFSEFQHPANTTLKLTQFTSIRSIIRKLYLKFHTSVDVSQYGIFLQRQSEPELLLDEEELFSTYHINSQSNLIFRNLSTLTDTLIIESKSLQLRFLVTTANSRRNHLELNFDPNTSVSKAIKMTGLRAGLLDSANKCGFYLTPSEDDDDGFWMDEDQLLDSYHLQNQTTLEFKQRCRKYTVIIKPGDRKVIFKFDQYATVQALFNILAFNEGIANVKDYCLSFKDSTIILDMNRYLWSYDHDKEIEFKENANRLYIFGKDGEQNLVFVDFNDPIEDVCKRLSTQMGFRRERAYTIKRLGEAENDLLDAKMSLKQLGVQPNDRLVLEPQSQSQSQDQSSPTAKVNESPSSSVGSSSEIASLAALGDQLDERNNVNIWEEPPDSPMNIVYSKTKSSNDPYPPIDAGTLNKLIIRLTSENTHDLMFMKALLMTYSSYTSAHVLLAKLFERFRVPNDADIDEREKQSIQLRVANVIKYWVEHHYEDFGFSTTKMMVDFVDTHMMQAFPLLGNQIRGCILKRTCGIKGELARTRSNGTLTQPRPVQHSSTPNANNRSNSSSLSGSLTSSNGNSLSGSLTSSNSKTSSSSSSGKKPRRPTGSLSVGSPLASSPRRKPDIKSKGMKNARSIFDFDDEEIARQLTLYDFMLYSTIKQTEFLNQAWNKPAIAARRSPTILQMINRFNEVGLWVVKLILEPERVRTRAKRMERVIRIAEKLRELKNFNTLMAFLGGLNNSAVLRLKFTRALVPKKYIETLEALEKEMSCESSYKTYRELLHNTDPPCVPYIGVYLTDLTFIEEGNPNIIGNNLINFSKYTLLYKVISEVQQYQWSEYNLNYVPLIQTFIKDLTSPTVIELYQVSLQKEPKGAQKSDIF